MREKAAVVMVAMLLFFPVLARAGSISLTLQEAVAVALRDNRGVLLRGQDLEKAKLKINEARGELLPAVTLSGERSFTRGFYPKDIGASSFQAAVKQYIYKGGEIVNTIKYNGYLVEVSAAILDKEKLDLVLTVQNAFYTLSLAERLVEINKAALEDSRAQLTYIMERYKSGEASESDILKAKAAWENVSSVYEESLNQVESGRAILRNLLYLDNDAQVVPEADFSYDTLELAFDEGFLMALEKRPEIKQYAAQGAADKIAVEIAKAGNRPSVYASWDYYSKSTTQLTFSPTKGWNDYNVIGLKVSWPIFDGLTTKAKVEQALVDIKRTRLLKEQAVKDIALDLKSAYLALKDALSKIKLAQEEIAVYEDNFSTAVEKYKLGLISHLDISQAELKYKVSLFNKDEGIYDYIVAKYSFEKATGGI